MVLEAWFSRESRDSESVGRDPRPERTMSSSSTCLQDSLNMCSASSLRSTYCVSVANVKVAAVETLLLRRMA